MSVSLQSSMPSPPNPAPTEITSPVIGQINYGWISEAWRLFSSQMGVWVVSTLVCSIPVVVFVIALYAMMWTMIFPTGFPPATPAMPPGSTSFPAPLTPGVSMNSHMVAIYEMEGVFLLVYAFWSAYMYGGIFRMAVRQVRGLPLEMRDIFRGGPLFGRMLGAIFLLGFGGYGMEAVCLGPFGLLTWHHGPTAALVVSGVVGYILVAAAGLVLTGLLLPAFALIADGEKVIPALKRSARAMKSSWLGAVGFVLVMGILVYASELLCGIGLLATIPMVFLICALVYRDMIGMPHMVVYSSPFYAPADAGVWPPPPSASPEHGVPGNIVPGNIVPGNIVPGSDTREGTDL